MKQEINYDDMARNIIGLISIASSYRGGQNTYVAFLNWRNESYVGQVVHALPGYDNEVVMISKRKSPGPRELVDALRRLNGDIETLLVDDQIDFSPQFGYYRRVGNNIVTLTVDQAVHISNLRARVASGKGDFYIQNRGFEIRGRDSEKMNPEEN